MSLKLWCPDCNTQTVVDMMSVYDGYEFACDDCKRVFYVRIERGLTQHALDAATVAPKCTTEKLCPVHNVWHAAPPRK